MYKRQLDTTQLFSDIYRHQNELYVQPLKVQQRYSPTMHLLHVWRNEEFVPVTDSVTISQILTLFPWSGLKANDPRLDIWTVSYTHLDVYKRQGLD